MAAAAVMPAPDDVDGVAEAVRAARSAGLSLAARGSGSKLSWTGQEDAAPLSLLRLAAPIEHRAGDLTATVPAGASLSALNAVLRNGGQWLPLDPPTAESATIGGIVAANDSGPRRHRYGAPRDLIIGIEMVLADGRRVKAGGQVVKNVAGYDLGRLLCGSFGSLAVITSVTFKLAPVPDTSRTVIARVNGARQLDELARRLMASPITPSAVEVAAPPLRLLIRFETTTLAAEHQAAAAADLCGGRAAGVTTVHGESEDVAWRDAIAPVWSASGALLKVSVLPTTVAAVVGEIWRPADDPQVSCQLCGRALAGVLHVRMNGPRDEVSALARRLRAIAEPVGGSAVLLEADAALRERVPRWGTVGAAMRVMQAVKAQFDPDGVFPPVPGAAQ